MAHTEDLNVQRYHPKIELGLNKNEVKNRIKQGLVNIDKSISTKSTKDIIKENTFTLFNFVNLVLAIAVLCVGSYKNLMFMGGTGLGKTHLSLAIANVALNKGYSVIYGTSQNIFSDLQDENFGRTDNIYYNEHDILNTDLLILDDLGTEFRSQFSEACLYNIVNTRILKKKATIISTNFSFEDLERDYNQRVTSRLAGEYSVLTLEGSDIRYIK